MSFARVEGKWQFLPVTKVGEKPDWGKLNLHGTHIITLPGTFYLDYRENGKRVRRAVGDHPLKAKIGLSSQRSVLKLRDAGMVVDDAPQLQAYRPVSGRRISEVVDEFIKHPPFRLRKRSAAKYSNGLLCFGKWTTETHVSQLDRGDINGFMSYCVTVDGLDNSTAADKGVIVQAVMNGNGATIKMKKESCRG